MRIFVIFCILFTNLLAEPASTHPYIFLSMPKSGTNLLCKLIFRLSSNPVLWVGTNCYYIDGCYFPPHESATLEDFEQKNPDAFKSLYGHLNFSTLLLGYVQKHPEFKKIILVRDLRDICVSTTYFIEPFFEEALGPNASFDEKLMYVIEGTGWLLSNSVFNIKLEAEEALRWASQPDTHIFRFEDLCGQAGGGSDIKQKDEIKRLAKILGLQLSDEEIENVQNGLWGSSITFRKGEIGNWKSHFKQEHIEAFNRNLGYLHYLLGYD